MIDLDTDNWFPTLIDHSQTAVKKRKDLGLTWQDSCYLEIRLLTTDKSPAQTAATEDAPQVEINLVPATLWHLEKQWAQKDHLHFEEQEHLAKEYGILSTAQKFVSSLEPLTGYLSEDEIVTLAENPYDHPQIARAADKLPYSSQRDWVAWNATLDAIETNAKKLKKELPSIYHIIKTHFPNIDPFLDHEYDHVDVMQSPLYAETLVDQILSKETITAWKKNRTPRTTKAMVDANLAFLKSFVDVMPMMEERARLFESRRPVKKETQLARGLHAHKSVKEFQYNYINENYVPPVVNAFVAVNQTITPINHATKAYISAQVRNGNPHIHLPGKQTVPRPLIPPPHHDATHINYQLAHAIVNDQIRPYNETMRKNAVSWARTFASVALNDRPRLNAIHDVETIGDYWHALQK